MKGLFFYILLGSREALGSRFVTPVSRRDDVLKEEGMMPDVALSSSHAMLLQ